MDNKPNSKIVTLDPPPTRHPHHVAIGMLCGDQIQTDTAMCLAAMTLNLRSGGIFHVRNSLVPSGRNMMVDAAQRMGAGWLLMLDSDMVFPIGTLSHLLARGKDIVGATYPKRIPPHDLNYKLLPGSPERVELASGVLEVAGLPAGVLLINMAVFDKLEKPYFQTPAIKFDAHRHIVEAVTGAPLPRALEHYVNPAFTPGIVGEDYFFCAMARAAGFKVWLDVDLSSQIGHIGQQTWFPQTHAESEAHGQVSVGVPKTLHH
jgi:hypothetical protein